MTAIDNAPCRSIGNNRYSDLRKQMEALVVVAAALVVSSMISALPVAATLCATSLTGNAPSLRITCLSSPEVSKSLNALVCRSAP